MQFGLSGFIWVGSFEMEHLHLVDKTAALGFDLFEVPVFEPADLDGAELGSALRQSGLASSVCTAFPPDRSFISDDPAARLRARDHLVAAIDLAAAMGASHLIGPHGSEWGYKQLVSPDERRSPGRTLRRRAARSRRSRNGRRRGIGIRVPQPLRDRIHQHHRRRLGADSSGRSSFARDNARHVSREHRREITVPARSTWPAPTSTMYIPPTHTEEYPEQVTSPGTSW